MDRGEKRRIERIRKKILKRGPRIEDFTVEVLMQDHVPYITFKELKLLLPTGPYLSIEEVTKTGASVVRDGEKSGVFTGDLYNMFEVLKGRENNQFSTRERSTKDL